MIEDVTIDDLVDAKLFIRRMNEIITQINLLTEAHPKLEERLRTQRVQREINERA